MATVGMKIAQSGEVTFVALNKSITGQVWAVSMLVATSSGQPLSLGRGRGMGIKLLDESVSRNHASLNAGSANEPVLRDLGRRNATFVNKSQLSYFWVKFKSVVATLT